MSTISSFFGLNIALRGLQAHQRSLDVTAHNVANQNTPGYTRQEASLVAALGIDVGSGALQNGRGALLGGGVEVQSYLRARDAFTDLQWRIQSTVAGYAQTTHGALESAQVTLSEPGDTGIAALLGDFWDAWQDLAGHPEIPGNKDALVINAEALVDAVTQLDAHLARVQQNATDEYAALTGPNGDVLTLARQIADLNAQIDKETVAGRQPNDLLDARDKAIDELSELGQVTITDLPNGGVQIAFGGVAAPLLVDDTTAAAAVPPLTTPGGKLGALLVLAATPGGTIAQYRAQLDAFVSQLVTDVNAAHGAPFFAAGGLTAGTFAVDPAIAANPQLVRTTALAGTPAGANDVALAVAALRGGAADKGYADLVLRIGADVRQAQRNTAAAEQVLTAITDKRDSISGVALDEEVTNMLRFQRGYQASSRAMSTLDEMLETLINRTGRVGL